MKRACKNINPNTDEQKASFIRPLKNISEKLIAWYHQNKRDLPWRNTTDPYKIWISEIILQQTRVQQGLDYYLRFIDRFPDVKTLANAPIDEVLKHWQGLGYYTRARNIHFAAQQIMKYHNGIFPTTYPEIISLKGIGKYSAAAIASFAFHLPHAVVDGNVIRVISRLYNITDAVDTAQIRKQIDHLAQEMISELNPADYNQAIMEHGASCCTPQKPMCSTCQLTDVCMANHQGNPALLPIKSKTIKIRKRYFHFLIIEQRDGIYLSHRTANDIWKGLYQFPLIETEQKKMIKEFPFQLTQPYLKSKWIAHVLTHQKIELMFYHFRINYEIENYTHVKVSEINKYPVPKPIENYIRGLGFINE